MLASKKNLSFLRLDCNLVIGFRYCALRILIPEYICGFDNAIAFDIIEWSSIGRELKSKFNKYYISKTISPTIRNFSHSKL